jgi:hypothetical protein
MVHVQLKREILRYYDRACYDCLCDSFVEWEEAVSG